MAKVTEADYEAILNFFRTWNEFASPKEVAQELKLKTPLVRARLNTLFNQGKLQKNVVCGSTYYKLSD